jgi:hypothetical protein
VIDNPIPYLPGEIKPQTIILQDINHTQALFIMSESFAAELVQDILTDVPERGMSQVMAQGNCLGQILIQIESTAYGAGYLGNLQGMCEPGYVMVPLRSNEDLCLVFEATESFGVDDTVTVTLKCGTHRTGLF